MDGSALMSPPTSRSRRNAGEEASPPPGASTHLTWRAVPWQFRPNFIASDNEGLRVAMLLELLLSNDTRGQAPGESDVKYETHLLKLIHSDFHGTGVKMPVNMNRGRALFSLPELRDFMAIISADDERALEVSGGCLAAVAKLRSSSLENACAWFPFGAIPEGSTMLRALKVVNSALAALCKARTVPGETSPAPSPAPPRSAASQSHISSLIAVTPGQCMTWDQSSVEL